MRIEYYSFKTMYLNLSAKPVPQEQMRHSEDLMMSKAEREQGSRQMTSTVQNFPHLPRVLCPQTWSHLSIRIINKLSFGSIWQDLLVSVATERGPMLAGAQEARSRAEETSFAPLIQGWLLDSNFVIQPPREDKSSTCIFSDKERPIIINGSQMTIKQQFSMFLTSGSPHTLKLLRASQVLLCLWIIYQYLQRQKSKGRILVFIYLFIFKMTIMNS